MKPTISVIVCTHNRADLLKTCLEALVNQDAERDKYEVIIIDNCSTDHSYEVCKEFLTANNNFKYVYETELGLTSARNRGLNESNGDYIAYIDDDAQACSDWVLEILFFIKKFPHVSVFGGPYEGFSDVKIPDWHPPGYWSLNLGDKDRILEVGREWIHGCNMVFKKNVLEAYGGFLTSFGMKGKKLSYGDEIRVIKDISEAGYEVYYASRVKVNHFIQKDRLSLFWLLKYSYSVGTTSAKAFNVDYSFITCCKIFLVKIILFLKWLLVPKKIPFRRRIYYSLDGLFYAVGVFTDYMLRGNG